MRGGLSTKINAAVDENGLPVRLVLTPGQAHDLRAAPFLLEGLKCRDVVADRGYDADALLNMMRASGAKAHIPSTSSASGATLRQPSRLSPTQPGCALLLQAQAFQANCYPLRQGRTQLPRCGRTRLNPPLDQSL
ncbi:transposase [Bradyrhizobium yuanmingense]|uniref:transposase n=1 Tax=Bradyrhizobium yuanmingense TaxID=108015 RepID=UPI003D2F4289